MAVEQAREVSPAVAIVTGAGSGIGRATAIALARTGMAIVVVDRDAAAGSATVEGLAGAAGADLVVGDITDPATAGMIVERAARLGDVDVLVNAVGWDRNEPFLDNSVEFIDEIVRLNLLGAMYVTQAVARVMVDGGRGGRIVNIASDAGRVGSGGETAYAAAKGGVIAFTKSLARELARAGVTVNCVSPGPTDTPLFHCQPERIKEALIRAIPIRRLGRPEEIAAVVEFLASKRASYVTGQVVSASGGLTMVG